MINFVCNDMDITLFAEIKGELRKIASIEMASEGIITNM